MDQSVLLLLALFLNAALAGPASLHARLGLDRAYALPGYWLRQAERKLNRAHRSGSDRQARGWILVGAIAAACIFIGWISHLALVGDAKLIELALVAILLPVRPLWDRLALLRTYLMQNDLVQARLTLSGSAFKHYAVLDEFGAARAGIESTAVDFSEKIVCPVLGYALFGFGGLLFCRAITLARDTFSHAADFGHAAARVHDWVQIIPSRATALLWVLAPVFLPSGDVRIASRHIAEPMFSAAPRALCVHAAAAAVGVGLGSHGSPYAPAGWVDCGPVKVLPMHLRRAQAAYGLSLLFLFVAIGVFIG